MKDVRARATGPLKTVLDTVSGYDMAGSLDSAGAANGVWSQSASSVTINPYFGQFRRDSEQGSSCGLGAYPHALSNIYYHEARHAYQFALMSLPNDEDHNYLLNNIPVAEVDVLIDTTAARDVCDEYMPDSASVSSIAFKGKNNPDPYGDTRNHVKGVGFAIEMDAHKFASQH